MTCDHEWISHYTADGRLTGYVCQNCPAYHGLPIDGPHREPTAFEKSQQNQTSSAGRWWGRSVIYGKEAEHATPYMTRYWIGRLRLHIFHRGDQDPDCHDHPWDFWTFPFTPYVEEVVEKMSFMHELQGIEGEYDTRRQLVPAWRLTFRPATHCHRVLGRYAGRGPYGLAFGQRIELSTTDYQFDSRKVITLVWRGKDKRKWGFLKNREGKWCWVYWKAYVFGGGKNAPCE